MMQLNKNGGTNNVRRQLLKIEGWIEIKNMWVTYESGWCGEEVLVYNRHNNTAE